jgi:hypothetical protein
MKKESNFLTVPLEIDFRSDSACAENRAEAVFMNVQFLKSFQT